VEQLAIDRFLCVPLVVGSVALLVDAMTAEWAVVFPIGIGVMWLASDWIMERRPS
jgi:hypothetical protein